MDLYQYHLFFIVPNGLLFSFSSSHALKNNNNKLSKHTMRIRKHAKTSSTNNTLIQAHVCLLNQSPWDVITEFSPPSSPMFHQQVYRNSSTSYETIVDNHSVSVPKWEEDFGDNVPDFDPKSDYNVTEAKREVVMCCKSDGKNWQCQREASSGNSLCEHHLALANSRKMATVVGEGTRRRLGGKKDSSNPYEFYYYSGFGLRWGKKRGDGSDMVDNVVCKSTLSQLIDEDLEDKDEELCERKRARKPIKARSLKSLM